MIRKCVNAVISQAVTDLVRQQTGLVLWQAAGARLRREMERITIDYYRFVDFTLGEVAESIGADKELLLEDYK